MEIETTARALLEAVPDSMLIVDAAGTIVLANAHAERLFGYADGELAQRPLELLLPERFRRAHADHRARYMAEPHTRVMGTAGVALFGLRKDGSEFEAEVSLSPIRLAAVTYTIAAVRDVTVRRRMQDVFRRVLEAAPDAVVVADGEGRIVLVNARAEALFGYPRAEMVGKPVELLIPARYHAGHPKHRSAYFAAPRARPMGAGGLALYARARDGREFPAEISLSPLETDGGVLAITTVREITDRLRAEAERARLAQAEEAVRLRDEFLSIASHELRTPVTTLKLQIDALRRGFDRQPPSDPRVLTRVSTAAAAGSRLEKLIDQLLDLSRISAGRLVLSREVIDLATLVRDTAAELSDPLERAHCALHLIVPPRPLRIEADPLRVEQVVTNLLSNAIKYGAGAPIELSVDEVEGHARLSVRDHGIGIEPSQQARIFQRFERAVSGRNYGGFGLGLWIARQFVEAHGGHIDVWSEPGAGAKFTVLLPLVAAPAKPAAAATDGGPACTVLLVDDDELIRESLSDVIDAEGYHVVTARDGAEALALLKGGLRPSLILLDLMMPRMDGAAFRAAQRGEPSIADIPVVAVSAAADLDQLARALGFEAYLRKPLDLDKLLGVLTRACRRPEPR